MTRMTCQTLLIVTLAIAGSAWGVQMPKSIQNERNLKTALKAAKTPQDHERIAVYCQSEADRLDAEAASYEQSAATYRDSPEPKNLMAPNTAARYQAQADEFRKEAQSKRVLAASQEQLARNVEQATR